MAIVVVPFYIEEVRFILPFTGSFYTLEKSAEAVELLVNGQSGQNH